jgi:hypothetical protein
MPLLATCVAAVAVVFAAGCGASLPTRAPEGPTPAQMIEARMAEDAGFAWDARRPLAWTDFQGPPPAEAGGVAAETAYALVHGVRCTGTAFEFHVAAVFRPGTSWVRPSMFRTPDDGARALRHEQTHFDLTEVHARRLRRYFAELFAPCQVPTSDLTSMAERIGQAEKAAQAQYDADTGNGRIPAQQARWDREVAAQLVALNGFAR